MKKILAVTFFAISMGYLESAVVIYLREIYYPDGFSFPLREMGREIAGAEVLRELATLIMLAVTGYLAGKNRMQRFGIFLYSFGIWDIFYYIFLELLIGWPDNLLTWDILFLVPVTWVGPVLAPCINALTMCIFGGFIHFYEEHDISVKISKLEWALLILGSLVILLSYTCDYLAYIMDRMPLSDLFRPSSAEKVMGAITGYVPKRFNWWLFGSGQALLVSVICLFLTGRGMRRIAPPERHDPMR